MSQLNILPPLIDVLTRGMGSSEETAAAAAVAFKYICEGICFA
jgi:transportin-3